MIYRLKIWFYWLISVFTCKYVSYSSISSTYTLSSPKTLGMLLDKRILFLPGTTTDVELYTETSHSIVSSDNQQLLLNLPATKHLCWDKFDSNHIFTINMYKNPTIIINMIIRYLNMMLVMLDIYHIDTYKHAAVKCFKAICFDAGLLNVDKSLVKYIRYISMHELGYGVGVHAPSKYRNNTFDITVQFDKKTGIEAKFYIESRLYYARLNIDTGNWRCIPLCDEFSQGELNMLLFPALIRAIVKRSTRRIHHRGK